MHYLEDFILSQTEYQRIALWSLKIRNEREVDGPHREELRAFLERYLLNLQIDRVPISWFAPLTPTVARSAQNQSLKPSILTKFPHLYKHQIT